MVPRTAKVYINDEDTRRRSLDATSIFNICDMVIPHFYSMLTLSLLQANEAFNTVISSGRDRRVWITDLRNPEQRTLLCEASAPVLRLCLTPDMDNVWIATEESSIKRYVSALNSNEMIKTWPILNFVLSAFKQPTDVVTRFERSNGSALSE